MERRNFLKIIGAGSALAGLGIFSLRSFEGSLRNMLLADTRELNIEEEVMEQFLADAEKEEFWQQFSPSKKGFIIAHTWLDYSPVGSRFLPYRLKYEQYRSRIVGTFLLSTDYFTHKMDPDLPVRYVAFYNPYKRACASPFSNFYYPV